MRISTTIQKDTRGKAWYIQPHLGRNPEFLHHYARFGMLSHRQLTLLTGLGATSIAEKQRALRAPNNRFIRTVEYQRRRAGQLWNPHKYDELDENGRLANEKRINEDGEPLIPRYDYPAGSDFEHRGLSVDWAVSFYAGAVADPNVTLVEWPELRGTKYISPTIHLDDDHTVNTDWPPFGVVFSDEHNNFTRGPEIDRNSERGEKLDHKFISHNQVFQRDLAHEQLGLPSDFIPWVTISVHRKQRLMRDLVRLIETGKVAPEAKYAFGFAVFPDFGSPEPLDTRAYTMPYERVLGVPPYYFNKPNEV